MPYITQGQRNNLDIEIEELSNKIKQYSISQWPGILNYCITRLILKTIPEKRYYAIAAICGVLKNVSDEFYRRFAGPYEDEQIILNGDVYSPEPQGMTKAKQKEVVMLSCCECGDCLREFGEVFCKKCREIREKS